MLPGIRTYLPSQGQSVGQRGGEAGGSDFLLRFFVGVVYAVDGHGHAFVVEDAEASAVVAVAGLADRAWVDELALCFVELYSALVAAIGPRNVGR